MKRETREALYLFIVVVLVGAILAFPIIMARARAQTYERLTGKHVTTWDALTSDLRIQEPIKP